MFEVAAALARDTHTLGDWPLCRVLLMNDSQYPWLILVPRREGVRELYELTPDDQQQLLAESNWLGRQVMAVFGGDKFNVAALGNQVPQLHVHHIVRFKTDPAWPGPVWGKCPPIAYSEEALAAIKAKLAPIIEKPAFA